MLAWFSSYAISIKQVLHVNGTLFKPRYIAIRINQGSKIGSLKFPLYFNDTLCKFEHGIPSLFAGDIKIVWPNRLFVRLIFIILSLMREKTGVGLMGLQLSGTCFEPFV